MDNASPSPAKEISAAAKALVRVARAAAVLMYAAPIAIGFAGIVYQASAVAGRAKVLTPLQTTFAMYISLPLAILPQVAAAWLQFAFLWVFARYFATVLERRKAA